MRVVCSGHLVRHPVGGHTWHHLQYLAGLAEMGHDVRFVEDAGWPASCYDPRLDEMTDDPSYGIAYLRQVLAGIGLGGHWCFVDIKGRAHGASRADLAEWFRAADAYISLSNMNRFPESHLAARRAVIDTDPVFTQIGGHGLEDPAGFHARFTYGENVGRPGCDMPTAGLEWLPTRQPVVAGLWPVTRADPDGPLTTVMNWSAYGACHHDGRRYGQKDEELLRILDLPSRTSWTLEVALAGAPAAVADSLRTRGWRVADPAGPSRDPGCYQRYLSSSAGELSVAKHAYVSTGCGWFSDRTCGYLASGRPAVVQDTGFSANIPTGEGILAFRTPAEAVTSLEELAADYDRHAAAARVVAEKHFDHRRVLNDLLSRIV